MKIDIDKVCDLEVDGVYDWDYPDFCDAFFCSGKWIETGIELTDIELDDLADQYPELVNEMAFKSLIS